MSWLNRVRNAIPFVAKRETSEHLWHKCKGCGEMVFLKEYEDNQNVCPNCGHHGRIRPEPRFEALFDKGSWKMLPTPMVREDPLKFRDSKRYVDRLKQARQATGESDALINAIGEIEKQKAVIGVQNFAFMGGSMGLGVGEAFILGTKAAIENDCPYIIFTASGGARMQEGILSLMQMPKMTVGVERLKAAGLPYIVVLTDPTSGGVMASYALLGDLHLAEPGATLAFTGRRVIENTIREKLPDDFQTSEYLLDHGMVDMIVDRHDLRERLSTLIGYLMANRQDKAA